MKISIFGKEIFSSVVEKEARKLRSFHTESSVDTKEMPLQTMRKIVLREPLINKAISKKANDTFRNWFVVRDINTREVLDDRSMRILRAFDDRSQFKNKLTIALKSAYIYGTGFIEKEYNEYSKTKPDTSVKGKNLINLDVLNSECIHQYKAKEIGGKQKYYIYRDGTAEIYIHPSRLEVMVIDSLPFSKFGNGKVLLLKNILKSKMNFDISSGEYLNWGGMGLYDLTIQNMTEKQEEAAHKELSKHPDFLVHDEDYDLKVENPKSLDPKEFIEFFYANIASALEMPKQMLIGGDFTDIGGSDVGVSAYYADVSNVQEKISHHIVSIYKDVLRAFGIEKDIYLDWNEIYVDELAEAKILQTRAYSAVQCINSATPLIDQEEGRRMLCEGTIQLDYDKKIEKPKEPDAPKISDPNINPQPVKKPEKNAFFPLTKSQKELLEKARELGRKELKEQEERVKEANENNS